MDDEETQRLITPYIPPQNYGGNSSQWRADTSSEMEHRIGISQVQLVPDQGKKLHQYLAALAATLGALATGTVLGWSASAIPRIKDNEYGFGVSVSESAWISSLSNLGAACVCIPIGFLMDYIGRRLTMLFLVIPFVLGWILLITAVNAPMIMVGRFITGLAGGAFCVTAPTYTSEIAQDSIRGTLGSFFQLMVTIGILVAYVIGSYVPLMAFNIVCTIIPVIFLIVFYFMPETPYFLVSKNRMEEAKSSLKYLRGIPDVDTELDIIKVKYQDSRSNPLSIRQSFSRIQAIKALIICYSIMFFQQFSGINAVLFNTEEIFDSSGADISSKISSIIIGVVQVAATLVSTVVVDKLGRKILLLFSGFMMCVCGVALGVFFYIKENDPEQAASLSWLPLVSLCIFIISFSLGFGPIPWMVAGELCTPDIKAFISSTAGTLNWLLAFIITTTFVDMRASMGDDGTFWFFAACSFASVLFVFFIVPETKGKSNDEIQRILGGEAPDVKK